jgi:hypothetical protein
MVRRNPCLWASLGGNGFEVAASDFMVLVFFSRGGVILPNLIVCHESCASGGLKTGCGIIGPAVEAIKPHPNSWTLDDG